MMAVAKTIVELSRQVNHMWTAVVIQAMLDTILLIAVVAFFGRRP